MSALGLLLFIASTVFIWQAAVAQVQQITSQPQDAVIKEGQLIVLNCVVANLVGNVQWLRDGFGLGPGPTFVESFPRYSVDVNTNTGQYNLVIANAQLEDDAEFQCQVSATDTTPGLQSRKAKLTVQVPPKSVTIGDGSSTVDIVANTTSTLQCAAAGARPPASLSWRSLPAGANEPVSAQSTLVQTANKLSSTTGSLTISPTISDDGRQYSCLATNNATVSPVIATVRLNVVYAPVVTITATPGENLREFDKVVFTCAALANPASVTWQWYIGDNLQMGEQGTSFVVTSVTRQFINTPVSCVATNKIGSVRKSISVSMTYGPRFTARPIDQAADLGAQQAILSCDVDSNPQASIEWTRSGSPVTVLGRSAQLTVSPVTRESFDTYTCTANVTGFAPISAEVRLLMNGPPVIVSSSTQSAYVGGTATIDCIMTSTPKPSLVTWSKDGQTIDPASSTRYKITEANITTDGYQSQLTISDVADDDFGMFNCTATNDYGTASLDITLSRRAYVPVAYILAGVIPGVVVIAVIVAVIVACQRRRSLGSELGSDNSESQITKHVGDSAPDQELGFSNSQQQSPSRSTSCEPISGSYNDSWGNPIELPPTVPVVVRELRGPNVYNAPDAYPYTRKASSVVDSYRSDIYYRPSSVNSLRSPVHLSDSVQRFYPTADEEPVSRLATNV